MAEAFVLITCDYGQEDYITNELSELEEILYINKVEGPYNILLKIKSETIDKIKEIVTSKIKTNNKIRHTLTLKVK